MLNFLPYSGKDTHVQISILWTNEKLRLHREHIVAWDPCDN